jgi:hypothetical protein
VSYFYPNILGNYSKVVKGYFPASLNESTPKILFSCPRVTIELVFLYEAVFSTMPKGFPGITNVAFIKFDPKSKPIRSADAGVGIWHTASIKAAYIETRYIY